ncbi:hypothetical protein POPTR_013G053700v4 [Populus trichocarpa]|uniref:Apyrase n=1 Tax=Populus trichocarpa TaxID=3694 RepID=A0A2K1Y1E1_POPTR|nr:hypothetical protein POPTR_013G053700v4 [Populus trichocarpa]
MGLIPLALLLMVFVLPPSAEYEHSTNRKILPILKHLDSSRYAVGFDAGSRVHVFCFDHGLALLPVGNGTAVEFFALVKPGLSAYADDPQAAAESLVPLLEEAERAVPQAWRPETPVRVGATAGLRSSEGNKSEKILQAVRDLLRDRSTLKSEADGVSILKGSQEGSFMWMAINYLVGNLGKKYSDTVGIVDLGGGSVQMAYTISQENAANAPQKPDGQDPYVKELTLKGNEYYLYVHSYLYCGLLAARDEILKVSKDSGNPCILVGYEVGKAQNDSKHLYRARQ